MSENVEIRSGGARNNPAPNPHNSGGARNNPSPAPSTSPNTGKKK